MLSRSSQLRKVSPKRLAQTAGKRIFSTLKPRSLKRIKEDRERYGPVRATVRARSGGYCEYPGCTRKATQMHEKRPAGRGGSRTDPDNIMDSCWKHHRHVHAENELESGHEPILPTPGAKAWGEG